MRASGRTRLPHLYSSVLVTGHASKVNTITWVQTDGFDLYSPKPICHCFRKQHGCVLCLRYSGTLTIHRPVYGDVFVRGQWLAKLIWKSDGGERSVNAPLHTPTLLLMIEYISCCSALNLGQGHRNPPLQKKSSNNSNATHIFKQTNKWQWDL